MSAKVPNNFSARTLLQKRTKDQIQSILNLFIGVFDDGAILQAK